MVRLDPDSELAQAMVLKKAPPEQFTKDDWEPLFRLPQEFRVAVPLIDKWALKQAAEILEGLAFRLRQVSNNPELSSNRALFYAWTEGQNARKRLQEYTKARKAGQ